MENANSPNFLNKPYILTLFSVAAILILAFSRIIPHAPNFTPLIAMALLGGVFLNNKYWAVLISIGAMFLSDVYLGFHSLSWLIYLILAIVVFIPRAVTPEFLLRNIRGLEKRNPSLKNIVSSLSLSFAGSLIFFLISNLGVFLTTNLYAHNFSGLLTCYIAALPFFTNTLLSTILYFMPVYYGLRLFHMREAGIGKQMI